MRAAFTYPALAAALLTLSAFAQELRITSGLSSSQVLQRDAKGTASAQVSGTATGLDGKAVQARVIAGNKTGTWTNVATVESGQWKGHLPAMPAGGPYTVELRAPGAAVTAVKDVYVGDLWILAGQSNMEGVGDLVNVQPPDPRVRSFDQSDNWDIAKEPLHSLQDSVDRIHWAKGPSGVPERLQGEAQAKYRQTRKKGAGLALPFAVEMASRVGVPIGLVPCAHGGTSMAQWDPAMRDRGGDSLYGSMYRRFLAVGGRVTGVLWYQGESDANPAAAPLFQKKFEDFVAAVRSDFKQPDLPFYYVQIGRHISNQNVAEWNAVQEAQRLSESHIPNSAMISAIDVDLDDGIHVGTQDLKRLGHRFALIATQKVKRSPQPDTITYVPENATRGVIRVHFSDVNGSLRSDGRINGFSVLDAEDNEVPLIYKVHPDPADGSTLLLFTGAAMPPGAKLQYGRGKNPYCNLHDGEDMGVPVFGPLPIEGTLNTTMTRAVAILNGHPYTAEEMTQLVNQYPIFVKRGINTDPASFLKTHLFMQAAVKAARAAGIEQKPPYKYQFDLSLMNSYLNEVRMQSQILPEEQRKYYEAHKDKYKNQAYETVRDQVYLDMINENQNRRMEELKAKQQVEIVDPEFFKNLNP